jgi:8-oxo-dGTP pyrophosphatase MutT (NUDIX family)
MAQARAQAQTLPGLVIGSVVRRHLPLLQALALPWLQVQADQVVVDADTAALDAQWHALNQALHDQGHLLGWRDELFAVPAAEPDAPPLARIERAAARFWGTLTLGAHANGYVADADGRPRHLWVARRALDKATDPGLHDNLVGGGVPAHQTPLQALVREAWEEAGLHADQLAGLRPGRIVELQRDIREGRQWERLHAWDLPLPAGVQPVNQDGEVMDLQCLPVADALALARDGRMTVDAALVTLDFALRHHLLPADEAHVASAALAGLLAQGTVEALPGSFHRL